jgi:hypothetical protein
MDSPPREGAARPPSGHPTTNNQNDQSGCSSQDTSFDALAALRRRRPAALRCVPLHSGHRDPVYPGSRYHRPSTGLAASDFQLGFARGALDALRELWPCLDDSARARAVELAARYSAREAA